MLLTITLFKLQSIHMLLTHYVKIVIIYGGNSYV